MRRSSGWMVVVALLVGCAGGEKQRQEESRPGSTAQVPRESNDQVANVAPVEVAEPEEEKFTYCCEGDCDPNGDLEMLLNPDFRAAGQVATQACLDSGRAQGACLAHGLQACMKICMAAPDPCP